MAIFRTLLACLACATSTIAAELTAPAIIAQARAALGTEAELTAIHAIQFELTSVDAAGKPAGYTLLEVAAPDRRYQLSLNATRTIEEVLATNGNEGWRKTTQTSQVGVLRAEFVAVLRDMAASDLTFFAAPAERVGSVKLGASTAINGRAQVAVEYNYKSGFRLIRHFDATTFLLTATDQPMPDGKVQRQLVTATERVGGILFTKQETILVDGQKVAVANYEKILLNPELVKNHFVFPTR